MRRISVLSLMRCQLSLRWTPLGQRLLSALERCPSYGDSRYCDTSKYLSWTHLQWIHVRLFNLCKTAKAGTLYQKSGIIFLSYNQTFLQANVHGFVASKRNSIHSANWSKTTKYWKLCNLQSCRAPTFLFLSIVHFTTHLSSVRYPY